MISPFLFIAIIIATFAFSALVFFMPRRRVIVPKANKHAMEMPCPTCQQIAFITPQNLRRLVSSEVALLVRDIPDLSCTNLAETRCDYCQSALTFRLDTKLPTYIGVDLLEPNHHKNNCKECREPLMRPTWPKDAYPSIEDLPSIPDKLGLECPYCGSVSCVSCLDTNTRKRTQDDTYLCPRCFRGPVNIVHHF